jgi:hypothetical protein
MKGLPVEQKLQGQANHDHYRGHDAHSDGVRPRVTVVAALRPIATVRPTQPHLHGEEGQGDSRALQCASKKVG